MRSAYFVQEHGVLASSQQPERKAARRLLLLYLLSLPFLNPWIRGDGVGYYALARAPLIQHNLDFLADYQKANPSFREGRLDERGQPRAAFRTSTGHLDNHFTVGPAILWSSFLIVAHGAVLLTRAMGSQILADGFSWPYRIAMAFGTSLCGFLGLLLSFRLARQYVEGRWALLSTLAIWWASSLPVYMYFNPSWSHAQAAFAVALFIWYWHETRSARSLRQWLILGLIAGLMLDVYYANADLLVVLAVEAIEKYAAVFRLPSRSYSTAAHLTSRYLLFLVVVLLCMSPIFITRRIIYGSALESGYISIGQWSWGSPSLLAVLFSANHGLISWTPTLFFAILGLFAFWRIQPRIGTAFLAAALAFYYFMASYPDWAGISSYGSRFFVSLTVLFVLGLGVFLESCANLFHSRRAAVITLSTVLACFVLWNAGLMFQWGAHLIPARGPISFGEMARNQFSVVPRELTAQLRTYLFRRRALMQQIEDRDLRQLKEPEPAK